MLLAIKNLIGLYLKPVEPKKVSKPISCVEVVPKVESNHKIEKQVVVQPIEPKTPPPTQPIKIPKTIRKNKKTEIQKFWLEFTQVIQMGMMCSHCEIAFAGSLIERPSIRIDKDSWRYHQEAELQKINCLKEQMVIKHQELIIRWQNIPLTERFRLTKDFDRLSQGFGQKLAELEEITAAVALQLNQ